MVSTQTLLLAHSYEPIRMISWKRALSLLVVGKVEVVETHGTTVRSAHIAMLVPAVVRLIKKIPWRWGKVRFSRQNIYRRDNYTCQYCGKHENHLNLTFDHILPKSRGGRTYWDNIVTACKTCNQKKGDRTPQEAGMRLQSFPTKPDFHIVEPAVQAWNDWMTKFD